MASSVERCIMGTILQLICYDYGMSTFTDDKTLEGLWKELEAIPRVSLVERVTPVRRLIKLFPNQEVWLKDDSQTHGVFGGNKPRKLEYLIAKAKSANKEIVTFGAESSNHALACSYHCMQNGVRCHLILTKAPEGMTEDDKEQTRAKLKALERYAASIEIVESYKAAAFRGAMKWARSFGRIMIVPPGGSNALGTLGYVRAGLELAAQVRAGELPEPELIVLPIGTGGTALGVAVGVAAAGLHSKVIAVKVVPGPINERLRLAQLSRQIRKLLPGYPKHAFELENLSIDPSALGAGYSIPTEEGMTAVAHWLATEGVRIENAYTGKTAALLTRALHGDKRVLFWLTYSGYRDSSSTACSVSK